MFLPLLNGSDFCAGPPRLSKGTRSRASLQALVAGTLSQPGAPLPQRHALTAGRWTTKAAGASLAAALAAEPLVELGAELAARLARHVAGGR